MTDFSRTSGNLRVYQLMIVGRYDFLLCVRVCSLIRRDMRMCNVYVESGWMISEDERVAWFRYALFIMINGETCDESARVRGRTGMPTWLVLFFPFACWRSTTLVSRFWVRFCETARLWRGCEWILRCELVSITFFSLAFCALFVRCYGACVANRKIRVHKLPDRVSPVKV